MQPQHSWLSTACGIWTSAWPGCRKSPRLWARMSRSFFTAARRCCTVGGERVRPLPPADLDWFVIVTPDVRTPQKTAAAYKAIGAANMTRGALSRKLEARIRTKGDVPPELLFNTFDGMAFELYPGLEAYWETMRSFGAREIHLAGSGPSIFTPVGRKETGTALELLLRHRHGWDARLVPAWRPPGAHAG